MASHHRDLFPRYTQQDCVCRMKPQQRDFNLINNDIPHNRATVPVGFSVVSFGIPDFVRIFICCVLLSQVFSHLISSRCFRLPNLIRMPYQGG